MFTVHWHRCGDPQVPKPLAVLLPWTFAQRQHVSKYTKLLGEQGWDVMVCTYPALAMWVEQWSSRNALTLVQHLDAELRRSGPRPVVFYVFSGAAKGCYAPLLSLMASPARCPPPVAAALGRVAACSAGTILDSSPVDFTSHMGQLLLAPQGHEPSAQLARAAAGVAAGVLDFWLLEVFEAGRGAMWSALGHPPTRGPALFLYSRQDPLLDAAKVQALAAKLRANGRYVVEQVWDDSPHVGHLVTHPGAYKEAVHHLLGAALQEWAGRQAVRGGAALQTQQQQQQQQGEVLVNNAAESSRSSCMPTPACASSSSSSSSPNLFGGVHWREALQTGNPAGAAPTSVPTTPAAAAPAAAVALGALTPASGDGVGLLEQGRAGPQETAHVSSCQAPRQQQQQLSSRSSGFDSHSQFQEWQGPKASTPVAAAAAAVGEQGVCCAPDPGQQAVLQLQPVRGTYRSVRQQQQQQLQHQELPPRHLQGSSCSCKHTGNSSSSISCCKQTGSRSSHSGLQRSGCAGDATSSAATDSCGSCSNGSTSSCCCPSSGGCGCSSGGWHSTACCNSSGGGSSCEMTTAAAPWGSSCAPPLPPPAAAAATAAQGGLGYTGASLAPPTSQACVALPVAAGSFWHASAGDTSSAAGAGLTPEAELLQYRDILVMGCASMLAPQRHPGVEPGDPGAAMRCACGNAGCRCAAACGSAAATSSGPVLSTSGLQPLPTAAAAQAAAAAGVVPEGAAALTHTLKCMHRCVLFDQQQQQGVQPHGATPVAAASAPGAPAAAGVVLAEGGGGPELTPSGRRGSSQLAAAAAAGGSVPHSLEGNPSSTSTSRHVGTGRAGPVKAAIATTTTTSSSSSSSSVVRQLGRGWARLRSRL